MKLDEISKITILGLGKSGMASARFFKNKGVEIFASDSGNPDSKVLEELHKLGIPYEIGVHTEKIFHSDLIIVSPGIDARHSVLITAQKRKIPVWPEIEAAYHFCPCPIIAITGTNGKSTAAALVAHLMKSAGRDARLVGNIGIPLLEEIPTLSSGSWAVMETSSFQLETITSFRPKISCILNITQDHLNRHPDLRTYIQAKAKIMENQRMEDTAVLNKDDPVIRSLAEKAKANILWFGEGEIYVEGNQIVREYGGTKEILAQFEKFQLQGKHNLNNLAAAAAVSIAAGLTPPIKGIETFTGLSHRLEFVKTIHGVEFWDDSKATNPNSAASALRTFSKPVILIAGGSEKGLDFSPLVQAAAGRVKALIALGRENLKILQAFSYLEKSSMIEAREMKKAVLEAFKRAAPGDIVLLSPACASFDLFHSAEERGDFFKRAVQELHLGELNEI
jgi:UDP-N-acetylmuramoylalanine--D-glutamate ligase